VDLLTAGGKRLREKNDMYRVFKSMERETAMKGRMKFIVVEDGSEKT